MSDDDNVGKKKREVEEVTWVGVQKNAVLHEAKAFHSAQIDTRKCCHVICELLFLVGQGDELSKDEATDLFYGVSKLFQSQDASLRRLVYLVIKALEKFLPKDDLLMVTASLVKDITGPVPLFRANAHRVLSHIVNANMIHQMDRAFKQAVVDQDDFVSSSVLVASHHMFSEASDTIKRWVSEVQGVLDRRDGSPMVKFHALSLLYRIKQSDPRAVSKIVSTMIGKIGSAQSPLAHCLLIRYALGIIRHQAARRSTAHGGGSSSGSKAAASSSSASSEALPQPLLTFFTESQKRSRSIVVYEAARAMCFTPGVDEAQIEKSVQTLCEFANSTIPVHRFAAVRTLSEVVTRFPKLVNAVCAAKLESLITDSNRSIATLAITTLLKTGEESNIDRLMKVITSFIHDIPDEMRIVLVEAVRSLCIKFPQRHEVLMAFLSSVLRDQGGLEYKRTVVESIVLLMNKIPESKKRAFDYLCELIEDCEYRSLVVQVINLIGREAPLSDEPHRYVRFIVNRILLDNSTVRAAAVSALAKFASAVPTLGPAVTKLIERATLDESDEVRDRAALYREILATMDNAHRDKILFQPFRVPLADFEYSLQQYLDAGDYAAGFTLDDVAKAPVAASAADAEGGGGASGAASGGADGDGLAGGLGGGALGLLDGPAMAAAGDEFLEYREFAHLGPRFKRCAAVDLSEPDADYHVACTKHLFAEHLVLQFDVLNALEDQVLDNISIHLSREDDSWVPPEMESHTTRPLRVQQTGTVYVPLPLPSAAAAASASDGGEFVDELDAVVGEYSARLVFVVKDAAVDDEDLEYDEGYDDEYELEPLSVARADFVAADVGAKGPKSAQSCAAVWEKFEKAGAMGVTKMYTLAIPDLQDAVDSVLRLLGLGAVDGANKVDNGATMANVWCVGRFVTGAPILARVAMKTDARENKTLLKMAVRTALPGLDEFLHSAVAEQ